MENAPRFRHRIVTRRPSTPGPMIGFDPQPTVNIGTQIVQQASPRPERVLRATYDRWLYHVRVYDDVLLILLPGTTALYKLSRIVGATRRFATVTAQLASGEHVTIGCGFNVRAAKAIHTALLHEG